MSERAKFALLAGAFLLFFFLPVDTPVAVAAIGGGLGLLQEYARLHVLTCLVPALFIAGTIAVFVKKEAVLRLLGPGTRKSVAYPVASVSGGILAVCSCTILPLFTGIYRRGAGIGPAVAFLFTGPAINVTAILLTGAVIGWDFAAARLVSAMAIAVLAGLAMAAIFREHDRRSSAPDFTTGTEDVPYPNRLITLFFLLQIAVLVLFGLSIDPVARTILLAIVLAAVAGIALRKFRREDNTQWMAETWDLTKKIVPYLFAGVFVAGVIGVVLPPEAVTGLVGENSLSANLVASLFGAFMYFATLTEVPFVQKLMALGMARGPAMTLFLTGNTLSLPSMIVLFGVMGKRQAAAYILLVIILSALAGYAFGAVFPAPPGP